MMTNVDLTNLREEMHDFRAQGYRRSIRIPGPRSLIGLSMRVNDNGKLSTEGQNRSQWRFAIILLALGS